MAKRLFNLPETKGIFQLRGIVSGTEKKSFYVEKKTKTDKSFRSVNFAAEYEPGKNLYISINGMPSDYVYFSKNAGKGQKPEIEKVAWSERASYNRDGFDLIGNRIGLEQVIDAEGKPKNAKKILTDYDSCEEIRRHLKDGISVFVKGKIDISSYTDSNGNTKRSAKLVPNQVSRCKDIDFLADKRTHDFNQTIVFTGINKETVNGKTTDRFVVTAKIVTYRTIEDMEFIVTDSKLASLFRKNLKPYNAIKVWGHIETQTEVEEIEDEDTWGEQDTMKAVSSPTVREFVITGADGKSIETEIYTEENILQAINIIKNANEAESDYGTATEGEWGSDSSFDEDEDVAW